MRQLVSNTSNSNTKINQCPINDRVIDMNEMKIECISFSKHKVSLFALTFQRIIDPYDTALFSTFGKIQRFQATKI